MANLKDWLLDAAENEKIEGVVLGKMGWGNYGSDQVPNYEQQPQGKLLTWEDALSYIDYEFDSGYGAPGCNAIYAWTQTQVFFIVQYDGSTGLYSVPRNPVDCMPDMPGR